MLATETVIDLGDAVANGIALFAAVMSIIALFFANSRAKDANEIALDANRTSQEARDIAKSAHQRTVEHYEHIESQDLARLQAEFKELTGPLLSELIVAIVKHELNPRQASNKFIEPKSIHDLCNKINEYTSTVEYKVNLHHSLYFLEAAQEVNKASSAYNDAYHAYLVDAVQKIKEVSYENALDVMIPTSVDVDATGRLRATRENLSRVVHFYHELLLSISYADDYRAEMDRIPIRLKALRERSKNDEGASQADSAPE